MSRSNLIKLILFTAAIFAPVSFTHAATLTHDTDTWNVTPVFKVITKSPTVRSDVDLDKLARLTILGTPDQSMQKILDTATADQVNQIATKIDKPAQNAKLEVSGQYATSFNPGSDGTAVDVYALKNMLVNNQANITLPIITSQALNKLSDTNNLGIRELVATGESNFVGSPKNRLVNIQVGAAKYDGLIVDKGAEFSFNQILGDVDAEHGFLPELVIKATGTIPEFGGGLCQVSSTMFRAAMNAGLPITARRNHSYAVQYYAPQGTDATIYPGVQDLKFVNNLSSPILIRTRIEGTKLYFDFYGTKDDRSVAFEGPVQYDRKPDGSLKATWTRHVTLAGVTTTQVFNSNYQPPALFHKEEQKSTPNPDAVATNQTPTTQPLTH